MGKKTKINLVFSEGCREPGQVTFEGMMRIFGVPSVECKRRSGETTYSALVVEDFPTIAKRLSEYFSRSAAVSIDNRQHTVTLSPLPSALPV